MNKPSKQTGLITQGADLQVLLIAGLDGISPEPPRPYAAFAQMHTVQSTEARQAGEAGLRMLSEQPVQSAVCGVGLATTPRRSVENTPGCDIPRCIRCEA